MSLKKTCLHSKHTEINGRMVPYSGWEMPVQYTSILEEHTAVRNAAGLFDVSHMGEITVNGEDSSAFLESITCNSISSMEQGRVQYNALINEQGGIVDDITIYRLSVSSFFIVVNASNTDKAFSYIKDKSEGFRTEVQNVSSQWGQIALQGPAAVSVFRKAWPEVSNLPAYYHFINTSVSGCDVILSRTGYTGEDGFEIYMPPEKAPEIWDAILKSGRSEGLLPCGLGARDSLRLEARYPLYGHELNDTLTPVESGIGWIVKEKEVKFPAYEKIISQKKNGPAMKVAGFTLEGPGIPREGFAAYSDAGQHTVLSGAFSPVLKKGIGTVLLPADYSGSLQVEIRGKKIPASLQKGAFVKGSAGK